MKRIALICTLAILLTGYKTKQTDTSDTYRISIREGSDNDLHKLFYYLRDSTINRNAISLEVMNTKDAVFFLWRDIENDEHIFSETGKIDKVFYVKSHEQEIAAYEVRKEDGQWYLFFDEMLPKFSRRFSIHREYKFDILRQSSRELAIKVYNVGKEKSYYDLDKPVMIVIKALKK